LPGCCTESFVEHNLDAFLITLLTQLKLPAMIFCCQGGASSPPLADGGLDEEAGRHWPWMAEDKLHYERGNKVASLLAWGLIWDPLAEKQGTEEPVASYLAFSAGNNQGGY
jgi:hypothetical protein